MNLAANISLLWAELPFLDRFDAAAAAGFKAVEVLFPYHVSAREIQDALRRNGLRLILISSPPPNYTGGERGFAAVPGSEARFQHDMKRVFRYAHGRRGDRCPAPFGRPAQPDERNLGRRNLRGRGHPAGGGR